MAFEPKKFSEIFEDMRSQTPATVLNDFEIGSVTRTLYETFSYELALLYEKMNQVYLSAFVDTAKGSQLDQVVAILGITRGIPDFSVGVVTFSRDLGNEDILVPVNTLVATEESDTIPKKVYQTIEEKTLSKDQTLVDIRVQAVVRGENQDTAAETVAVMPRPVPGIKSVINNEAITLIGRRRETDEELRERAKNALISSGKASLIAIENSLLALQEVVDVKVQEDFRFASGIIRLNRADTSQEQSLAKGTTFTYDFNAETRLFFLREDLQIGENVDSIDIQIQAKEEGFPGEVTDPTLGAWSFVDENLNAQISIVADTPIVLGDFGIISVFVDAPDFEEKKEVIQQAIEKVRAAGILVNLDEVQKLAIGAIIRIEIAPNLTLTQEERLEFETDVAAQISEYLSGLKMGDPLLFSQLTKEILNIENIIDMTDYEFSLQKKDRPNDIQKILFNPPPDTQRLTRVEAEPFQRIRPAYVAIASEEKRLLMGIEFRSNNTDLEDKVEGLEGELSTFFQNLNPGGSFKQSELITAIESSGMLNIEADSFKLKPQTWHPRPNVAIPILSNDGTTTEDIKIDISIVEQAVFDNLFVYNSILEVWGAIKVFLPLNIPQEDKANVYQAIIKEVKEYVDNLNAQEDIELSRIEEIALAVNQVLKVELEEEDFDVLKDSVREPNRPKDGIVDIKLFEKSIIAGLCVTDAVEILEIIVTEFETLVQVDRDDSLTEEEKQARDNDITQTIRASIDTVIEQYQPLSGANQEFEFINFQNAIEQIVAPFEFSLTKLKLAAVSLCIDERRQLTGLESREKNIHIRSLEVPRLVPIGGATNPSITDIQSVVEVTVSIVEVDP